MILLSWHGSFMFAYLSKKKKCLHVFIVRHKNQIFFVFLKNFIGRLAGWQHIFYSLNCLLVTYI